MTTYSNLADNDNYTITPGDTQERMQYLSNQRGVPRRDVPRSMAWDGPQDLHQFCGDNPANEDENEDDGSGYGVAIESKDVDDKETALKHGGGGRPGEKSVQQEQADLEEGIEEKGGVPGGGDDKIKSKKEIAIRNKGTGTSN